MSRHALAFAPDARMCHGMSTMARLKKLLSVYIDPELLARLEEWLAGQEFPPTKTAAVEAALREFLDRREASEKPRERKGKK